MCISFVFQVAETAADAGEAIFKKQHDDVSCDGVQVGFIEATSGRFQQLSRIPITSESAVMAMLSAPRKVLGEDHEYIKACDPLPCLQTEMKAAMTPGDYVACPQKSNGAVYRSISTVCAADTNEYVLPEVVLEEGVCVSNSDGSVVITLRTANVVETDDVIQKHINDGKYRDMVDYLLVMKNAAWNEFKRVCDANRVDMTALFECTGEKDINGRDVVDPIAIINFMDNLYPCLIPGSDIVVLLPPVENGKVIMNTAFSLKLEYEKRPEIVWLPSLHHNDAGITEKMYEQSENYFVYTNASFHLELPNFAFGNSGVIRLCEPHEFLPSACFRSFLRDLPVEEMVDDDDDDFSLVPDYDAWHNACTLFQQNRHKAMKDALSQVVKSDSNNLYKWDNEACFTMTNLLGSMIPKSTNFATIRNEAMLVPGSAHTEHLRRLMKKGSAGSSEGIVQTGFNTAAKRDRTRAFLDPIQNSINNITMPFTSINAGGTGLHLMLNVNMAMTPSGPMDVTDSAGDNEVTKMLKEALEKAVSTEASTMATFIARGMNSAYAPGTGITKDCIQIGLMTDAHKGQLAMMLKSMA